MLGILAGILISIGSLAYLSVGGVAGAILFANSPRLQARNSPRE